MSPTRPRRRLALALTLGVVLLLGATAPAGATKAPKLVMNGGDRWFTHESARTRSSAAPPRWSSASAPTPVSWLPPSSPTTTPCPPPASASPA